MTRCAGWTDSVGNDIACYEEVPPGRSKRCQACRHQQRLANNQVSASICRERRWARRHGLTTSPFYQRGRHDGTRSSSSGPRPKLYELPGPRPGLVACGECRFCVAGYCRYDAAWAARGHVRTADPGEES